MSTDKNIASVQKLRYIQLDGIRHFACIRRLRQLHLLMAVMLSMGRLVAEEPHPLYCVIDLSAGSSSTVYPVNYLSSVPEGGWTDVHKTTKLVLRWIEPGTFTMGSPSDELGRSQNYEAQHAVTLTKGYWMGVFEVTQRQWELVMGERPSYFANAEHYMTRPVERVSFEDIRGQSKGSVVSPSAVDDSLSFLGKLRGRTGLSGLDLPTEAQWEYACRAGTTTALNTGVNLKSSADDANLGKAGRYWHNGGQNYSFGCSTSSGTAKVGSYRSNALGLYDMHGNVWEWCLDWWMSSLGTSEVLDPLGAESGSLRVYRGGSWGIPAQFCRSAYRACYAPSYRSCNLGFRVSGYSSIADMPVARFVKAPPVPERTPATKVETSVAQISPRRTSSRAEQKPPQRKPEPRVARSASMFRAEQKPSQRKSESRVARFASMFRSRPSAEAKKATGGASSRSSAGEIRVVSSSFLTVTFTDDPMAHAVARNDGQGADQVSVMKNADVISRNHDESNPSLRSHDRRK